MRELILNGVNADGTHLLLNDENGLQYRVVLDEALIAAVRRDRSQSKSEAPVRPKEIQAMIRGGMDAEDAKRLKELEGENTRLKRLLAEAHLDIEALKIGFGVKR